MFRVGTQRGVQLLISRGPGLGDDFSHISSVADWVTKYPKLEQTFSNCSPNQPNLDKISCIGEFELPGDLQPGVYTFMWWWEFNAGEFYNQCADVEITGLSAGGGSDSNAGFVGLAIIISFVIIGGIYLVSRNKTNSN